MDVLTSEKMKMVDSDTIDRYYPGLELMERAGRQVADFILERFPAEGFKAAVFVGPGNNGGDALVVARYLADEGRACSMHYLKEPRKLTIDALKNYDRLKKRMADNRNLVEINSTRPDWDSIVRKDFLDATVIVDGLFGTGLSRELEGRARKVVELINASGLPVVSIDAPSGIHGDTGAVLGEAVRADHTVTMGYPKLGMLFYPGRSYVGELQVADLQFPDEVLQVHSLGIYLLDTREAARRFPQRPPDGHKYTCGTLTLVSGSRQYTGATLLAAEAALRSGCGMVYAAVPESVRPYVESQMREVITFPVPETGDGTIAESAMPLVTEYLEKSDALAVGPGMGRNEETARFVQDLVTQSTKPVVLDADGVNAFAGHTERLKGAAAPLVLTPHSGELKTLLGRDIPQDPLGRVDITREAAKSMGAILVHKGAPTLIASAEGDVWVNFHGNSALASAGTGDVLTGLVGGTLAQGANALDGACVACYLHGRAGEFASELLGLRGVIAGDLCDFLGDPILELESLNSPK